MDAMEPRHTIRSAEAWEPETRAPRAGHFRITFTGYHAYASGSAPDAYATTWNTPEDEDGKAYFQVAISRVDLTAGRPPQTPAPTSMITGDVRGLEKRPPMGGTGTKRDVDWLPLSLGTYALVSKVNAIAIGNPTLERGTDRNPVSASRHRSMGFVLTFEAADALAKLDQGFGRGIFPVEYKDACDPRMAYTLYFRIDRV